jgi:hypothetical protein
MVIQYPAWFTDSNYENNLIREFRILGKQPEWVLSEILSNVREAKKIVQDYKDGKIIFGQHFINENSRMYKDNLRIFGNVQVSQVPSMLGIPKQDVIDIEAFVSRAKRPESRIEIEAKPIPEPIITEKNINLYRILFDDIKKQSYLTAINLNQPMKISDIERFESMPKQYLIEDGSLTPKTAIGAKLYLEILPQVDSVASSFGKPMELEYTYTINNQNITVQAKSEQEAYQKAQQISKEPKTISQRQELVTTSKVTVYEIDSNGNLASYVVQATLQDIQNLLKANKYIFEDRHKTPTLQEVQEHYQFVRQSENKFSGVTIGSIIAGALGLTFLMSVVKK